ncbi:Dynein-1-beta heavy chain [Diplonema papillatum]|nr:Dynein-1-beta heavy chain [Diplonema papillatum]
MSFVDKDLAHLVEPVDEELLEGAGDERRDRAALLRSWRGVQRLQEQGKALAQQLPPAEASLPVRPPGGPPLGLSLGGRRGAPAFKKCRVTIPRALEAFAPASAGHRASSATFPPQRLDTSSIAGSLPASARASASPAAGRVRPSSVKTPSRPHSAKSGITAASSSNSVGPSTSNPATNPATQQKSQTRGPEELWSDDGSAEVEHLNIAKPASPLKSRSLRSPLTRQQQRVVRNRLASPLTPIERIACLYNPAACIRTMQRDAGVSGPVPSSPASPAGAPPSLFSTHHQFNSAAGPAAASPAAGSDYRGVVGVDPSLSHFLPLSDFDSDEHDKIDLPSAVQRGPVLALSMYFTLSSDGDGDGYTWRPCRVLSHDEVEQTFLIEWLPSATADRKVSFQVEDDDQNARQTKHVKRLNLIVQGHETLDDYTARAAQAAELREVAERSIREYLLIDDVPDEMAAAVTDEQIDRILGQVPWPRGPSTEMLGTHYRTVIEKGLNEMRVTSKHALKEGVFRYRMLHGAERRRLAKLRLPAFTAVRQHANFDVNNLRATFPLTLPADALRPEEVAAQFARRKQFIEGNLFFTHRVLSKTISKLVANWDTFQSTPLFDGEAVAPVTPCEVSSFKLLHATYLDKVTSKLKREWTISAVSTIQTDLMGHYSFFDDDIEAYDKGRMKRFLRVVNMIMGHQLRELVYNAVELYSAFLKVYAAAPAWEGGSSAAKAERPAGKGPHGLAGFTFGESEEGDAARHNDPAEGRGAAAKPAAAGGGVVHRVDFPARFLEIAGTRGEVSHRGAPELRAEIAHRAKAEQDERKRAKQAEEDRVSIGFAADDRSAPQPGSLEFIRRRASRSMSASPRKPTADKASNGAEARVKRDVSPKVVIKPVQPTDEELSTAGAVSGNVSLFRIKLTCNNKSFVFEPSLEEIEETIRGTLDGFFIQTDDINGVGQQLFPLLQLEPFRLTANTRALRETDDVLIRAKKLVSDVLENCVKGPLMLLELYSSFQYILDIDKADFLQEFITAEPPPTLADYRHLCQRLQDDANAIAQRSLNEVSFALVKVECYDVKMQLSAKAKDVMNTIMEHLTHTCTGEILSVDRRYNDIMKRIQIHPLRPEDLHELKEYTDSVPGILEALAADFDEVTETVQLLSFFGYIPEKKSFEVYWSTYSRPRKIMEELADSEFKYKGNRHHFVQQLREQTVALMEEVAEVKGRVEQLAYEDDETRLEEMYSTVQLLRSKLNDFSKRAEQYNAHEKIFNMPITKHSLIKETNQLFAPYEKLWSITHMFNECFERWHSGVLLSLNAEEVESKANGWIKDLAKLQRTLASEAPVTIVKSLKEKLDQFKPHIPLVTALLETGFKARHWDHVGRLIGKDGKVKLPSTDDLTLRYLLDQDLASKLSEVQALSEGAAKEWRLEDQLEKMKAEWKSKYLDLKPFYGTHVLSAVDSVQQLVDDQVMKTQSLLGSVDVTHIEDVVKKWEAKLLRMSAVLHSWLRCQSTWSYLVPIFASVDIQKSLPSEAQLFEKVDAMWRNVMTLTVRDPRVEIRCSEERVHQAFEESNKVLEAILKQLHKFLETKRAAFARFYFLSNEDLIDVLSDSKDPQRIQKHLKKCFEGISSVRFTEDLDITHMISTENEVVALSQAVNPADSEFLAERWLSQVEKTMKATILLHVDHAVRDYAASGCAESTEQRQQWMTRWPGQIVICVSQIFWASEVENAISQGLTGVSSYTSKGRAQLASLVDAVRGKLAGTHRLTIQAMIVIEVHAADIVETELIGNQVTSTEDFTWQAQLRYYYEEVIGFGKKRTRVVHVRQTTACLQYGCEYLGNSERLVITPLTDRCYRTLMGALHLSYGGAPEGPAGTGKTETTKDLAKALAKYCLVYNCSDQISHLEMAKMFRGLAASGSWACFDEFNRIEVQVLSVVAQQILTIQTAIARDCVEFEFEGQMNGLEKTCSIFVTMNPGYAGRAELPDNLKALFRPVAMMVPDYAMIGEILLFSCGFSEGRALAIKIVATYKLCSEQLSSQHHYDYGMRAVKTVLTASGRFRADPAYADLSEKELVLRALYDVNRPKFLPEDLKLFRLIARDLFPDTELAARPHALTLGSALTASCKALNLQPTEDFINSAMEVYATMSVRNGMMLIGDPFSGKTSALNLLVDTLGNLHEAEAVHDLCTHDDPEPVHAYLPVDLCFINPKAITVGQLYGMNDAVMEWSDGVLSYLFRSASNCRDNKQHWIVLDGPVDAMWVESMNTVLDDNKKLCLLNGDIIHMTKEMRMVFEVSDLAVASPATVSRCGMVYFNSSNLPMTALFSSWKNTLPEIVKESASLMDSVHSLVTLFAQPAIDFVLNSSSNSTAPGLTADCYVEGVEAQPLWLASSLFKLWKILLQTEAFSDHPEPPAPSSLLSPSRRTGADAVEKNLSFSLNVERPPARNSPRSPLSDGKTGDDRAAWVDGLFISALVWAVGGWLSYKGRERFNAWLLAHAKALKDAAGEAKQERRKRGNSMVGTTPTTPSDRLHTPRGGSRPPNRAYPPKQAPGSDTRSNPSPQNSPATPSIHLSDTIKPMYELHVTLPDPNKSLFDVFFAIVPNPLPGAPAYTWREWAGPRHDRYAPDDNAAFEDIIIPTPEMSKQGHILSLLLKNAVPVLFSGPTGTGKSLLLRSTIEQMVSKSRALNQTSPQASMHYVQFTARTTSASTQMHVESCVERRRKGVVGPGHGRICYVFIDDFSMPEVELSGAQPALELIRLWQDHGGWYSIEKETIEFKHIVDVHLVAAQQPGYSKQSGRVLRHFFTLAAPQHETETLRLIFTSLLAHVSRANGYPTSFSVKQQENLVDASIHVFNVVKSRLPPTPEKPHYLFNLRDLSKVFQGMSQGTGQHLPDTDAVHRLWVHEQSRVFQDRLISCSDKSVFDEAVAAAMHDHMFCQYASVVHADRPLIFADPTEPSDALKTYQEIDDIAVLKAKLEAAQAEHNENTPAGTAPLELVVFNYVIQHVSRVARVLRMPRGNVMVVGLGGRGRQSTVRLATYVVEYRLAGLTQQKNYTRETWREDLRRIIKAAAGVTGGSSAGPTTLMLSDENLADDGYLEDVSCLLNTGEVPALFDAEDLSAICDAMAKVMKQPGLAAAPANADPREAQYSHFLSRTRRQLHVVLCFSPVGSTLRARVRTFPSLVNCCSIDFFEPWPEEGLLSVARYSLGTRPALNLAADTQDSIVAVFAAMHNDAKLAADEFKAETDSHIHVTPASYLDLLSSFARLLDEKSTATDQLAKRYEQGIQSMMDTESAVSKMQEELKVQQPKLAEMAKKTAELIEEIRKDELEADATRAVVSVEERSANAKAEEAKKIKDHCEAVLLKAKPALDKAMAQVADIDKRQLVEIRSMSSPSDRIKQVLAAVCVCLGLKPIHTLDPTTKKKTADYWATSKRLMADTNEFLNTLLCYKDREGGLDPEIFDADHGSIQPYLKDRTFLPDKVRSLSKALAPLCSWVIAMERYYQVENKVRPKKVELEAAEEAYTEASEALAVKAEELRAVNDRLAAMRERLAKTLEEKEDLEAAFADTGKKLHRAKCIIEGLGGEKVRYAEQIAVQRSVLQNVVGDALLAASYIAYLSPFTQSHREGLTSEWLKLIQSKHIPVSPDFTLARFLSEDVKLEEWHAQGLPKDRISSENAVISESSDRWCLFIDPQQQAANWIKERYSAANLQLLSPGQEGYLKSLVVAVRSGCPVLLEGIDSELDPILYNLLSKTTLQTPRENARVVIGDQEVKIHANWTLAVPEARRSRLFLATRAPKPNFKPAMASRVTLVAFTLTKEGLHDQLIGAVVQHEERDLDEKRSRNVRVGARNSAELQKIEDDILELLSREGSLLDDEDAVASLDTARKVADEVSASQREVDRILGFCERAKRKFQRVCDLSARLFFTCTSLSKVDPMYLFSLQWFLQLFTHSLAASKASESPQGGALPADDGSGRARDIATHFFYSFYSTLCRSLFARNRQLLSFLMAVALTDGVPPGTLRFLCTLGTDVKDPPSLSDDARPPWVGAVPWKNLLKARTAFPEARFFDRIVDEMRGKSETAPADHSGLSLASALQREVVGTAKEAEWEAWYAKGSQEFLTNGALPGTWEDAWPPTGLQGVLRVLLVRCLRPDALAGEMQRFVACHEELGRTFAEPPLFTLGTVVDAHPSPSLPLILVLSPGVDPTADIQKLSAGSSMSERTHLLSLGMGMQHRAEKAIAEGRVGGHWIVLQNCHLFANWLPQLARIVEEYQNPSKAASLHPDFRLWLTSMPTPQFPASLLMSSSKIIMEAPRGLRANMIDAFSSTQLADEEFYGACGDNKPARLAAWQKLTFALCFFHAIVQERRSFGALGWNISYDFNKTDLAVSLLQLKEAVELHDDVPFKALLYLTGECSYGGRVTDDRDRRCLMATLSTFYNEEVLSPHYRFDLESDTYKMPDARTLATDPVSFLKALPFEAPPSVFGLNANAVVTKSESEARDLLASILSTQPRKPAGPAAAARKPSSSTNADASAEYMQGSPVLSKQDPPDDQPSTKSLVDALLSDLPAEFDVQAVREQFPFDYNESMNTVLVMELLRFNNLLAIIRSTLEELHLALKGLAVMTGPVEKLLDEVSDGVVPSIWLRSSYPSLKPLAAYLADLQDRCTFFVDWIQAGVTPSTFWISGFFFTQSFLTGVHQNYARRKSVEIDKLSWAFSYLAQQPDELQTPPPWGCYIHGLYLEGAAWDDVGRHLTDAPFRQLYAPFPVVWLNPKVSDDDEDDATKDEQDDVEDDYGLDQVFVKTPLYKTLARRGVLSTTGHNSNFVIMFNVPIDPTSDMKSHPEFWVQRGTALVCSLNH